MSITKVSVFLGLLIAVASAPAHAQNARERVSAPPDMMRKMSKLNRPVQAAIEPVQAHVSSTAPHGFGAPAGSRTPTAPRPEDAGAKVSVDIEALKGAAGDIGDVRVFRDGAAVDVSGESNVALAQGEFLAIRSTDVQPVTAQVEGATQTASPTSVIAVDSGNVARQLALIHRTRGLVWDYAKRQFTGELLVGIIDRANPGQEAVLPNPIPVQLLAAGGAVSPNELEIDRVGGRFKRVDVAIPDPEDPFEIQLVSRVDPDLPGAALPLKRIQLVLMAPEQVDALGVGNAEVTVRARNGQLRQGETVTLYLDNGDLQESTLVADGNGVAHTRVRSTRTGEGTLSVSGGPYAAAPVEIRYAFPVLWLVATLLGAMLGASIFVYTLARRKAPRQKKSVGIDWLVGVAVGIGTTAMAYAGMKLPAFIPMPHALAGVIVPFALAFVCAAMGSALIRYLTAARAKPEGG